MAKTAPKPLRRELSPVLVKASDSFDPAKKLKLERVESPAARASLGDTGLAVRVTGPGRFDTALLIHPYDARALTGIEPSSVRFFRCDAKGRSFQPLWNSGVNTAQSFVWSKIQSPGVYVAIGLPRDRLLEAVLQVMADQRRYADTDDPKVMRAITESALALLMEAPEQDLELLRQHAANVEFQTTVKPIPPQELRMGRGGHLLGFALPQDASLKELKVRLAKMEIPPEGLPEEQLFFRPELGGEGAPWAFGGGLPSPLPPGGTPLPPGGSPLPGEGGLPRGWEPGDDLCPPLPSHWPHPFRPFPIDWPRPFPWPIPWPPRPFCRWFSRNWWMYHHDSRHTGVASGCSKIRSTSVGGMILSHTATLSGTVVSIPTIVNGKIYVGTANRPGTGPGGAMYRIDLASGAIEAQFDVERRSPAYYQGVGGSPAVLGGRLYFTGVPGWVYCLDASTFVCLWRTDLRNADPAHLQPVNNNLGSGNRADSWSSPLVVNGRVYIGCGEGEDPKTYGFVYCLDANTGSVIWLYCTSKFINPGAPGMENNPNVIPTEVAVSNPLPPWAVAAGFSIGPNPSEAGSSVWSSCAYDAGLNRVYVGTGNSAYSTGTAQPDERYGSGLLSLDATNGAFKGFHQSSSADSYRPEDADIDVCGSPTVFTRAGKTVVGYGSKNGCYFVLDADTLAEVAKRQLLPKDEVTGGPLPNVDPDGGFENQWGIYGTAALHSGLKRLFVGLGGRVSIDHPTTPFVRALDWTSATLADGWPTAVVAVGGHQVRKYTAGAPPLYSIANEVGLSSPAVVNDVVFVSTSKPAMYAFDAAMGNALWTAPGIVAPGGYGWILGPAIYGNYVVMGCGSVVHTYSLP